MNNKKLLEKIAELEHLQWCEWTKYMLNNLNDENINRWKRQIETKYDELSEEEKRSDRRWAKKTLDVIEKNTI